MRRGLPFGSGLVMLAIACGPLGCGPSADYKSAKELPKPAAHEHGHGHSHAHGPNGGELIEIGKDEFHAELLLDGKAHTATLFLLGKDAKTAATTAATEAVLEIEGGAPLTLKAADGQPADAASKFVATDEKAVHGILDAGFIHGTLKIKIGEKSFAEPIDIHFDHDHAHESKPADAKPTDAKPTDAKPADAKPADAPAAEKPAEAAPAAAPEAKPEPKAEA